MNTYRWKQAWLITTLLPCLAAGQGQAATIIADGNCTLADAITAANTDTATGNCTSGDEGKDIIELTYSPLFPDEVTSDHTMAIIITDPITPIDPTDPIDNNWLPQITTEILINGNGNTLDGNNNLAVGSLLYVTSSGILTLNKITITGGIGYIGEDGHRHGGGIYNNGGSITINNSTVSENEAAGNGGGIYSNGGALTLTDSTVSENSNSVYPYGAGINYGGGIFIADSIVTLNNSTVRGNRAWSSGGGIYSNGGALTLTDSIVSENETFYENGGGIYANSSSLRLTNSTINKNRGMFGSGIYAEFLNDTGDTITLTNSTVSKNVGWLGGGICVFDSSLELINSTVSKNSAYLYGAGINYGGGMAILGSTLTLTNSTVSENEAVDDGGGIFIDASIVTLTSSLISGNRSTAGEGNELYNYDSGTIYANSSNLFGHSGESNAQAFAYFTPGGGDVNATNDGTSGILKPTSLATILLPLTDNGGPTQTHALVTGSPAIDLDATCSAGLSTDQRGEPRPATGCDAGAFEGSISTGTAFLPTLYLLLLNN